MTDNIIAFDFNGVKVIRDSNTELIQLIGTISSSGTLTFFDTRDNTKYQVPASKKATMIFLTLFDAVQVADKIIQSDDEDASTNPVTLFEPGILTSISNIIFISAEVAATKFINQTAAGGFFVAPEIWVIEEDA